MVNVTIYFTNQTIFSATNAIGSLGLTTQLRCSTSSASQNMSLSTAGLLFDILGKICTISLKKCNELNTVNEKNTRTLRGVWRCFPRFISHQHGWRIIFFIEHCCQIGHEIKYDK